MTAATRFIAFDTETTGLGAKINRLIEIAAVEFDPVTGLPTGNTYYTLLNPEQEVEEAAAKVHGKTWEMLKDAPKFADIITDFRKFVEGAQIVIHNAPFDVSFMDEELNRAKTKGKKAEKFSSLVTGITDTLSLSRQYVKSKVHTLDSLCDRYGVDKSARTLHGALVDCELLANVYPFLMADVREKEALINAMLPFCLGEDIPADLDDNVERYLALAELEKLLAKEKNRYGDEIKRQLEGVPTMGDFYQVKFTNRVTTDWERITTAYLKDVDLGPYQKLGSAMSVSYL